MANFRKTVGPGSDDYLAEFRPIEVEVINDRVDIAVMRFRTLVTRERIMSDLKEHQAFEKPSMKRRRKQRESLQRQRKLERSQQFRNLEENNGKRRPKEDQKEARS